VIDFCGLRLAHPIVNGSGTFDLIAADMAFGEALRADFPFSAFISKTITLQPRHGNPPPRLYEAPAGLINSIGLPNKGLAGYLSEDLPRLARLLSEIDVPLIANVMGADAPAIAQLLDACQRQPQIAAVELNVSCPNVATGLDIGADPQLLRSVLRDVRPHLDKPLIVKLTPNTADVAACAQAAQEGGADAVSLINTLRALALGGGERAAQDARPATLPPEEGRLHGERRSPEERRPRRAPWLGGSTGGLSGPAIRPIALAQVAAVAKRVQIPIIGMGGVQSARHAHDLLDVGATLVAVGSESFRDPAAGARIARAL
jgi:dihydroorotate dehydrogenase (NAD+) catalytic subunit